MADLNSSPDADERALALMQSANALIENGRLSDAADALEQAAHLHREAGRTYDEARCTQMAATLRRAQGDSATAAALVERAASIAIDDLPLAVSIAVERAESLVAGNRFDEAVTAWTAAIEAGERAGLGTDGMTALLRRRAAANIVLDRLPEAGADYERAVELTRSLHGEVMAALVLIEEANQLYDMGHDSEADAVVGRAEAIASAALAGETQAGQASAPHLRAELHLVCSRMAARHGDWHAAESHASQARAGALAAVAPVTYFAAGVQLAEILDRREQRTESYAVLATAWATLSDLLGADVAQSWVAPVLVAYRLKWGDASFEEARSGYEARRRAETAPRSGQS